MNVSLVMVTSDGKAKEIPLPHLPAILGRGDDCKIRIPVASVSRRHCEVSVDSDDELVVKDLKSSNGTFVNGERVSRRELVPGDLLAVGPVVFVVRIDGHPKEVDPVESYVAGSVDMSEPHEGSGGDVHAISGVPTWSGMPSKPSRGTAASNAESKEDLDDGLSDLLADLDLSDDDDGPKKKK